MKIHNTIRVIIILTFFVITACQNDETEADIYHYLEETAIHEETLGTTRDEMAELEDDEHQLYTDLIEQSFDDQETIEKYVEEAEQLIAERLQLVNQEKEHMKRSQEEFSQIEPLINEVANEDTQASAKKMYEIMLKRYDIYDEWYEKYVERLDQEEVLYDLFLEEEFDLGKVNKQVETINQSYDEAQLILDEFSEQTKKYNEAKKAFYEQSDLNIAFD